MACRWSPIWPGVLGAAAGAIAAMETVRTKKKFIALTDAKLVTSTT